jgi:hypothetical protein
VVVADLTVTRLELVLGAQNSTSGWYEPTYNESTIKMAISSKGNNISFDLPIGKHINYNLTGYTGDVVKEGDKIRSQFQDYYTILTSTPVELGNSFHGFICELELQQNYGLVSSAYTEPTYTQVATSDNATHRTKLWLDTYLSNVSLPAYITAYSYPTAYNLIRVFKDKAIDLVFSIQKTDSSPLYNGDKTLFGYEENINVTINAIDKDVAASTLIQQAENEITRLCDTHQFGSLRFLKTNRNTTKRYGAFAVYGSEYVLSYRRDKPQ